MARFAATDFNTTQPNRYPNCDIRTSLAYLHFDSNRRADTDCGPSLDRHEHAYPNGHQHGCIHCNALTNAGNPVNAYKSFAHSRRVRDSSQ